MPVGTPVDQGHANGGSGGTVTTLAQINAGDTLVLCHGSNSTNHQLTGITDTAGNTGWKLIRSFNNSPDPMEWWYCPNSLPMAAGSSIFAVAPAGASNGVSVVSVPGLGNTPVVDVQAASVTATATSATPISTGVLASSDEIVVGGIVFGAAPGTVTIGAAPFTALGGTTGAQIVKIGVYVATAPSAQSWAPTWVNSVSYRSALISIAYGNVTPPDATPPNTGGAVVGGRRRQILARKPHQAESRWTRETPPQVIKPPPPITENKTDPIGRGNESATVPAPTPSRLPSDTIKTLVVDSPAIKTSTRSIVTVRPAGPTWADMERARVELVRLRQELADQQDEDDIELLLVSLH